MGVWRTRVMPVTVAVVGGVLLGLIGPAFEKVGNPVVSGVGAMFSIGWTWACYAFLVGYWRRSKIESSLLAPLGLVVAVITYYVFKDLHPTPVPGIPSASDDSIPEGMKRQLVPDHGGSLITDHIGVWAVGAVIFGAPLGFIGNVARTPGIGGLPFRLLIPVVTVFEANERLRAEADTRVLIVTLNTVRIGACVVAVALVGHTVWSWRTRRSRTEERTEIGASAKHL
ncbi:hypothetical protein [Streptomyces sp. CBMA152]|uniref:hypothetical protein n=1 Tax=Streptomyces sp. CBMA152 TaxID=1896312 RepID=UPI001661344E|nr:hypothetical protein [Streptomyces sp. CBMA152]MBD0748069.1 hypothetical protein [Streptomyces sp. CBMA152]